MSITRRGFLGSAGLSALALAGKPVLEATVAESAQEHETATTGTRWGMVIDPRKCLEEGDCTKCIDACNREHNIPHIADTAREVKWIWSHGWELPSATERPLPRSELLGQFEALLNHFSEVEDLRFKVKAAEFDPDGAAAGSARVRWYVFGRDGEGRREWLKAWLRIEAAQQPDGSWKIGRLGVESIESRLAELDLFSEIARESPPYVFGEDEGLYDKLIELGLANWSRAMDIQFPEDIVFVNRTMGGHLGNLIRLRASGPWRDLLLKYTA